MTVEEKSRYLRNREGLISKEVIHRWKIEKQYILSKLLWFSEENFRK